MSKPGTFINPISCIGFGGYQVPIGLGFHQYADVRSDIKWILAACPTNFPRDIAMSTHFPYPTSPPFCGHMLLRPLHLIPRLRSRATDRSDRWMDARSYNMDDLSAVPVHLPGEDPKQISIDSNLQYGYSVSVEPSPNLTKSCHALPAQIPTPISPACSPAAGYSEPR